MDKYQIPYTNLCIRKFSERFGLSLSEAFAYLYKFGGMKFLVEFYDIEHTLPIEDTVEELMQTCADAGGHIK
ncbi:MAG: DUF3791 domain-containing protein [Fibrobacteraceae bacterium]|nr:DUF3791 domain-containing protein [Fibrobacteraceae bacterium]